MNFRIPLEHGIDFVGDIHACYEELIEGMERLGYQKLPDGTYIHPNKRKILFLGDMMSRGPYSLKVMRLVMDLVENNLAYAIDGNHNWKVARYLMGRNVKMAHGDERFVEELKQYEQANGKQKANQFREEMKVFLLSLSTHYIITDQGKDLAVAVHAGIRDQDIGKDSPVIRSFTRYGDTAGLDEKGKPIRKDWTLHHHNDLLILWGHDPRPEAKIINNTMNLDQGCVFGGRLSFLRYPEMEIVQIDAKADYVGDKEHLITKYFQG
ncbi:metallophosphoesterase [Tepidibacillus marianensis]|uniref:metallophosphoesterase n=1 Tax=Tepidibacillus marianensis TaxID=3131995 RepID=UPI0030D27EF5